MNNIERIGLDVGFGDVKAAKLADGKLSTISFPSVLGQAQDLTNFGTGLGGATRRKATRLVYDGVSYYIGDDALKHSRTQAGRQDRQRIGSTEERVLALAALARLDVSDAYIVTGLPVLWFDDRGKLARSLRGNHEFLWGRQKRRITVHGCIVLPQPFGGFYAHALDTTGQATIGQAEIMRTYGFLDIGWNTTDLSAIQNLAPVERWSGGERVGVRNVIEIVGDALSRRFGLALAPHEIDTAIQQRRIEVFGDYHDIGDLIDSAITSLAQQVVAAATRLWGNGERMSHILIFGGGAAVLGQSIKDAFPRNGVLLSTPALTNAIGFSRFAQRDIFSKTKSQNGTKDK
ncbi:MAG: ParM/StbA family protein [Anaerolineales bacterium]|nr:ParM/StbA family protein [Anaerolineales bacterium]